MATPPAQLSFFTDEWPDGPTYLENHISAVEADRLVQEIDAAPLADSNHGDRSNRAVERYCAVKA
ncbi:hypothetical protein [Roseicyclus amphidinii]|uniref:hypothetical protein n=1 Tax=Roseicyclus amphidinii TaxID=3034232 RepID=UPI0024E1375C|nr:hypothetical protein [Roseicyclus sp. Amp-Y-6]